MKSISRTNPSIKENMECSIIKVSIQVISCKSEWLLDYSISQCFISSCFKYFVDNFHSKKNTVRSDLLALHLPKCFTEIITGVLQIVTYKQMV